MTGPPDPATSPDPTQAIPAAALVDGRYRLDHLVGRGGTAEVWQATDTSLDRVVALKLVTIGHDESSARAADEARTLARLSHPSLVQVYDAGTDTSGRPWVVMEFVDGETLADAVRRGPQPIQKITDVGIAVADALDHVHAQGLVHRDVKPANVLIGRNGRYKLTDFGIARLVDAAKVTSTGMMVGTASYLAPEQVAGEPIGPATDVYALGLVLLESLTGNREYDGPAVEAAMTRLHRSPVVPDSVPPGWGPLLSAMTARQSAERPTAADVARQLRGLGQGDFRTTVLPRTTAVPLATVAVPQPTQVVDRASRGVPVAAPAPVAKRSRATAGVIAALLAVIALAVGGVLLTSQDGPQPREIAPTRVDLPPKLKDPLDSFVEQVRP